ncbi:unnamed protein product [Discosporangium mesarthrocarpum]
MENDSCALDPELLRFARLLPKVELHAHLHGCARPSTIKKVGRDHGVNFESGRNLAVCFQIFDVIHQAVCDLATVQRIAQEALEDMAADGVLYAELRTTPRPLPDGTSRRCYVEGVLAVFRDFERKLAPDGSPDGEQRGLIPRLLLSASRAEGLKEAEEMTALALDMARHAEWGKYVLGVDFSGNPRKGSFTGLRPAFDAARRGGLKVSLHCGEVTGEEEETQAMIDFRPDRLGHAILLGEHTVTQLLSLEPRIPIEICPTSNRLTLDLDNHGEHPTVPGWIKHG